MARRAVPGSVVRFVAARCAGDRYAAGRHGVRGPAAREACPERAVQQVDRPARQIGQDGRPVVTVPSAAAAAVRRRPRIEDSTALPGIARIARGQVPADPTGHARETSEWGAQGR